MVESQDIKAKWMYGIAVLLAVVISLFFAYRSRPVPLDSTMKTMMMKREWLSKMRVDLHKSVEMEKNAVIALTDEESRNFADQSRSASADVDQDIRMLDEMEAKSGRPKEKELFLEFKTSWMDLRAIDQIILDLAVQNTNLKAASLSQGKGLDTIHRFGNALSGILASSKGHPEEGRIAGFVCNAMMSGYTLYSLHAVHIAESQDAKMDQMESRMKSAQNEVQQSLDALSHITGIGTNAGLSEAKTAFAEFMDITGNVIKLSRQNSNVKSLELSLGRKRKIAAQCDEILGALQESAEVSPFRATR